MLFSQFHQQQQQDAPHMEADIDFGDFVEAVDTLSSPHDRDLFDSPYSPSINFGALLASPMQASGTANIFQSLLPSMDHPLLWNLSSDPSFANESWDFQSSDLQKPRAAPAPETANTKSDHGRLVVGRPKTLTPSRGDLKDMRTIAASLLLNGETASSCYKISSQATKVPGAEDIIENLESLLPDTATLTLHDSGLTLMGRNAASSSDLFKMILYSFTNSLAGLRDVPRSSLLSLLRNHHEIRTGLFEVVRSGPLGIAKAVADSLFRAAVEGSDADAVATIFHHTKCNPKVSINPNEVVCSFKDRDYTPIELAVAAQFRNTELVRTLVAASADPNKTYKQNNSRLPEQGALALALGHWRNGSSWSYEASPPGEPQPMGIDLLRLLLDCGAEIRVDLAENAMRPGSGHTVIAEELISRIPASEHRVCFQAEWLALSIVHYLENSAATRNIRRFFAHCSESTDCGRCVSEQPKLVEKNLCHAARRSNLELTEFLVQHTVQLQSALAAAVRADSDELVLFLVGRGARVDEPVESWHSPEEPSKSWDHADDMYDEDGYDRPTIANSHREYVITPIRTPLAEAIRARNDHLINTFRGLGGLDRLADKHHFHAAVYAAAEVGNISFLNTVLDHASRLPERADLTLALAVAIRNDESDAALMLLDAGASYYNNRARMYGDPFINVLKHCNKLVFKSMLECDVDVRGYMCDAVKSPLEVAATWCEFDVIEDLIHLGIDIDFGIDTTTLGAAVISRNETLARQLLEIGANPQAKLVHADGISPLRAAMEIGDYDMVRFLISKGAFPADNSAFVYAMGHDQVGYGVLLSEFRSRYPHGLKDFGGYLLAQAMELDSQSLIDSLLNAGADVNSWCTIREPIPRDFDNFEGRQRVLGVAIQLREGRNYELVRKLLDRGAGTDCIVSEHKLRDEFPGTRILETPLLLAIKTKDPKLVSLLFERGANLNMPARRGIKRAPLQAACKTGSSKMVEFLPQSGAKVNSAAAERDGGTALQMAAKTGSLKIVKLLLDNNADPHMAKSKVGGRTAFEAAAENGSLDILTFLWNAALPLGFSERECESAKDFAKQKGHRGCMDFIDFLSGGSSQSFLD